MIAGAKRLVGRAGLKLEAALDRFGLAAAVAGARAVDVGASTGGFTQVLLDRGAASVVSVDVGHGQLDQSLRRDPRVESLERTDWKHLALSQAPGPFDFFTVDVSFVAARNMLRGLAFRLRAGAEGVVLVKPQFELPARLVRDGDVTDEALRAQALGRFTAKAAELGFRVVEHGDSPVPGASGTVEILAHLAFDGRPARLPRPGETRGPRATVAAAEAAAPASAPPMRPAARSALEGALRWFAVASPGTEVVAAQEISRLPGVADPRTIPGGVAFLGPIDVGMRANLELRVATRILLRFGEARAREFGQLRHRLARIPWEAVLAPGALRLRASASHCRLFHTGALEETVAAAIGDRLGARPDVAWSSASDAPLVLLRGLADRFTASVDSSGERLHVRGWRTESGEAPLRETLAAALLEMCEWRPGEALFDPMCGAGTIPIEACQIALGLAPGRDRGFAFERWPGLSATARAAWLDLRRAAAAAVVRGDRAAAPILASDADPAAVAATRRNAERAGVSTRIQVAEQPLALAAPPAASGLLIANPPYGARLGQRRDLPRLYREIGNLLRTRFAGWRAGILVADPRLASAFRVPVVGSHPIGHGGLRVSLLRLGA